MAIQWDKSLAVGVKIIDEQHRELFRRVNTLLDSLMKGDAKPEVEKVMAFLGQYVVDHFAAEERLMAHYKYPTQDFHKGQHAGFVAKFVELKKTFEEKGAVSEVSIALNRFVCTWLREHIAGSDRALGKHLAAVGSAESRA
jgi:hemerythrin